MLMCVSVCVFINKKAAHLDRKLGKNEKETFIEKDTHT